MQRRQLEYLVEVVCRLPVEIRVIPTSVRMYQGLAGPFTVWTFADRDPVTCTENLVTWVFMEEPAHVAAYLDVLAPPRRSSSSPTSPTPSNDK